MLKYWQPPRQLCKPGFTSNFHCNVEQEDVMVKLSSLDQQTALSCSAKNAIGWQVGVHSYAWSPPTDVYETDASFIVRVEVAGMRQSDFSIDA